MSPGEVLYLNFGLDSLTYILNNLYFIFIFFWLKFPFFFINSSSLSLLCPGQAEEVFSYMAGDFMRPVVDIVDQLLSAGVNVTVYNGQLDLIVDTMGNFKHCCLALAAVLAGPGIGATLA